jgi:hypothetical protein
MECRAPRCQECCQRSRVEIRHMVLHSLIAAGQMALALNKDPHQSRTPRTRFSAVNAAGPLPADNQDSSKITRMVLSKALAV